MTTGEMRELDAWIAEHVCGWDGVHFNGPIDRVSGKWYGYPRLGTPRRVAGDRPFETRLSENAAYMEEIPAYSTFAAFPLLLSKLIADGWVMRIDGPIPNSGWTVSMLNLNTGRQVVGTASALPLAFCLVAKGAYTKPETKQSAVRGAQSEGGEKDDF